MPPASSRSHASGRLSFFKASVLHLRGRVRCGRVRCGGRGDGLRVGLGLPAVSLSCPGEGVPSQAGGWPVIAQSVCASPPWARRVTEVPRTAACPRDLPAWKENASCCGQANTAAVCPGIGAPVWRELTDRTFCRLPALFQNSLVLAGPG